MTEKKDNLTKNLKEIADIVAWFEKQEDVDIEEGIQHVRRGAALIKKSKKRLAEIDNEFIEIKKSLDA